MTLDLSTQIESAQEASQDRWDLQFNSETRTLAVTFIPQNPNYSGTVFLATISFSLQYPLCPPSCRFSTKMFHPNVTSDGKPSLNVFYEDWNCCWTVKRLIEYIYKVLFVEPVLDPPQIVNQQASEMFSQDRLQFYTTAKENAS
jgi:ubiquitin-protein ligase